MDLLTAETFICICIYKIQILYLINKQIVIMQLKNFKSVQSLVTKVLLAIIILLLNFHFAFTFLINKITITQELFPSQLCCNF